jgi:hypothetical protein
MVTGYGTSLESETTSLSTWNAASSVQLEVGRLTQNSDLNVYHACTGLLYDKDFCILWKAKNLRRQRLADPVRLTPIGTGAASFW